MTFHSTKNFVYNDGGRAASGREGSARDCGVRAMAIALDLSYEECYRELEQANKDAGGKKSARNGLKKSVYEKVLNKHGWFWMAAPKFEGRKCKASDTEGVCIARKNGKGIAGSFTVRKISFGEGVERVFPLHSTNIDSITVVRRGRVRRAKLYYLRSRRGKSARIAEATNYKAPTGASA